MALVNCVICNKEFNSGKGSPKACPDCQYEYATLKNGGVNTCAVCNTKLSIEKLKQHTRTCSVECQRAYLEIIFTEKYGATNPMKLQETKDKRTQTNLKRYNVTHPAKLDEFKSRTQETNLKKYGVTCTLHSQETKDKMMRNFGVPNATYSKELMDKAKDTMFKNHGVRSPLQSKEIREKAQKTTEERFGVPNAMQLKEVRDRARQTMQEKHGYNHPSYRKLSNVENYNRDYIFENFTTEGVVSPIQRYKFADYFNIRNASRALREFGFTVEKCGSHSLAELAVKEYLSEKYPNLTFESGVRGIIVNPDTGNNLELDIVIKNGDDIVCCVEYNGTHWHDKENPFKEERKTRLCAEKGIKLFHIWEDDEEIGIKEVLEFIEEVA